MYGLPIGENFEFLLGATTLQVCVGANEVIIRMDPEISITIEGEFSVSCAGELERRYLDAPSGGRALLGIINGTVERVLPNHRDGSLRLEFNNKCVLTLHEKDSPYESYQVWHAKKVIVV